METSWEDSRRAFTDAGTWFVEMSRRVGHRWGEPGLGEWDVRALVGHTSRSFLTVEAYVERPAAVVDVGSAADYFRSTRALAADPAVTARGRDAGAALGVDPPATVAATAERVVRLLDRHDGTSVITTIAGGMRLGDYLPTRTFELCVHTADLAVALDEPLEVPATAAAQALQIISELALLDGRAGPLLLAATGRTVADRELSVL